MDSKRYALILIIVVLLLRIISEIYIRQNQAEQSAVQFVFQLWHPTPGCSYNHQNYRFLLSDCASRQIGQKIFLIGSISHQSDKSFLAQKRLVVQETGLSEIDADSDITGKWKVLYPLFDLKTSFLKYEKLVFGSLFQKISSAIVMGDTSILPQSLHHKIEITGTQHLFAISGFHVTVIIGVLDAMVSRLPTLPRTWLPLVLLWLVAFVVGMKAALIRSVVMYSIGILAKDLQRRRLPIYWLLLSTMAVMLAYNPWYLIDIGFQLSVVATIGLLITSMVTDMITPMGTWLAGVPSPTSQLTKASILGYLAEGLAVSAIVSVIVAPISLFHFGSFSFLGIIATPLLVWLVPMIMVSWVVTLLTSVLFGALYRLVWLVDLPARVFESLLTVLQPMEFLYLKDIVVPFWLISTWYVLIGAFLIAVIRRKRTGYELEI